MQRNGCLSSRRSYLHGFERGARSIQITLDFTVEWTNIQWSNSSSTRLQRRRLTEESPVQAIRRLPEADSTAVSRPTKTEMQIFRKISSRSQNWSKDWMEVHIVRYPTILWSNIEWKEREHERETQFLVWFFRRHVEFVVRNTFEASESWIFHFFVVAVWFRLQSMRSTVTDAECTQYIPYSTRECFHSVTCCEHREHHFVAQVLREHKIPSSPSSHAVVPSCFLLHLPHRSPHPGTHIVQTTSSSAPPNITPCGTVTRNEERGTMATKTPVTGYEPNLFDIFEDYDGIDEIFRWSRWRAPQERLCFTTANAVVRSKNRPDSDSSLTWREFVAKCTVDFSTNGKTRFCVKRKTVESGGGGWNTHVSSSSPARANSGRSKIVQKYEEKPSFDEKYIRNLRNQIDSRDWDLRRTVEVHMEASQTKDRLQQEVADKERALHEEISRNWSHEEESWIICRWIPGQNYRRIKRPSTISWTVCEKNNVRVITCMIQRISRTPNRCTVDNFHTFPVNPRYFLSKMSEETCFAAPKIGPPNIWNTPFTCDTFLHVILYKDSRTMGPSRCRKNSRENQCGAACTWR